MTPMEQTQPRPSTLDALIRLMLVRAAAFGDGATASFAQAAGFLGRRLGACAAVQLAFLFLQLVAAIASAVPAQRPGRFRRRRLAAGEQESEGKSREPGGEA